MNQTRIDYLRDFAIENLPRAKADREQINRFGSTSADLYSRLALTAVMERAKAGTTAVAYAAANVLESVCLLSTTLSKKERVDTLHNLTDAANGLCLHAETIIPWLGLPEPEPDAPPAPAPQQPLPLSIAGTFLSTAQAAEVMGYQPQTLRQWSSNQNGPVQPTLIGRRLRWPGDDILALMAKANAK